MIFFLVFGDEPTHSDWVRMEYDMQGPTANHQSVTLSLRQPNFFGVPFPPRRFLRDDGWPGILKAQ